MERLAATVTPMVAVAGKNLRASEDDRPMTLTQTAEYLQMSRAHLSNVINGKVAVPPLRHAAIGRRILVRRSWADHWLEELAVRSTEKC